MKRVDLLRFVRKAAQLVPSVTEHLSADAQAALKAADDLGGINAIYHDATTQALITFFEGGSVTAPRNAFKRATVEAFTDAFDLGYVDGGGELPTDEESNAWLNARVDAEFGFIEMLFEQAKELRKEEDFDYPEWVTARSDGYTQTVSSVYNAGILFAKKNQMLTWHLGQTEKHCSTCSQLDGKSHRASWYIAHDYIPRKPGASMECGGWQCDCRLEDKSGNEVTI